jgi:hypothetical protein
MWSSKSARGPDRHCKREVAYIEVRDGERDL